MKSPPQLFAILKNEDGSINKESVQKRVLALEEMFEASLEIHKSVCSQGRKAMEIEGDKFYCNFTGPIIEIFLNYISLDRATLNCYPTSKRQGFQRAIQFLKKIKSK